MSKSNGNMETGNKTIPNDVVDVTASALKLLSLNINNNNPEGTTKSQSACSLNPSSSITTSSSPSPSSSSHGAISVASEEALLHKLSKINGAVNKMTHEQLREQLKTLGLNTCGVRDILKKRLKNHHKRQRITQSKRLQQAEERTPFDFLVVIDYEATCEKNNDSFLHEIIEFPAVLIDVHTCAVTTVFQRFCKPKVNRRLTRFCTELTGITQDQVDKANYFSEVFKEFEDWLRSQGLGRNYKFAVVTDGPWDMARFLRTQVELSGMSHPAWGKHWINLRKSYSNFYSVNRVTLHKMLDDLGMVFEGRPHCGLDDARNIAAIAIRLLKDGCVFRHNEHLHEASKQSSSSSSSSGSSRPRRKTRFPNGEEVEQEGENVDDLLLFAKLQRKK